MTQRIPRQRLLVDRLAAVHRWSRGPRADGWRPQARHTRRHPVEADGAPACGGEVKRRGSSRRGTNKPGEKHEKNAGDEQNAAKYVKR